MKKVTYLIVLFPIYILLSSGCNNKTEKKGRTTISVDIEKEQTVFFNDLFSHIELIPLETNEKSLIRDIRKLIIYEDTFYIFDYNKAEILRFDSRGKYLNKISDRGEGPKEYVNIGDFEIDSSNNIIRLLSGVNNSIYEYDLNGNFKNRYKLPEIKGAYKCFRSINNDTIVFFTFDYNNRIKFYSNNKKKIIKQLLPENENMLNVFAYDEFPYSNYLHRASSNTLFTINDNCTIGFGYAWDFGNLNNTKSQIKNMEKLSSNELQSYFSKLINSELINQIIILHGGNSQFIFSQIWRKGKHINIFHDKIKNKNFVFEKMAEGALFHPLSWHGNYVIGYYSDEWGKMDETLPNTILDSQAIKMKENLTEYDNPILIKYYFKQEL
ncbi:MULTISPECIES: 6-bladed beta-propeller [unclassified Proteiniphilum]|jgi:hypothetical protein|uniref:6-bladed beta-propeller n=1 Tax=unclassified Proteiniphilum TaxID=2622718 RepID=UPI0025806499|nr:MULTISPECIES: 6-bladed beta-propeller [unclassified Proteiniphilum]MDD3968184.1 6-bladed beta-propeller [Proteiniphilum sp.]MDD4800395.1 6-bladed beta-propeller [Proteiniphilum sp.]